MNKYILILMMMFSISLFAQEMEIINPIKEIGLKNWRIVNDNVMGGISSSDLFIDNEKNLIFKGEVSLDNNGGFASCRHNLENINLSGVKYFKMRIKGDGKSYKFRVSQRNGSTNYSTNFETTEGTWLDIEIPITDLIPTFMGYYSRSSPKLKMEKMRSIGFQISDKQEGDFNLEIMYVKAIR
jgi:monofunctional biosynthetic peptidoglycan transglycosylase